VVRGIRRLETTAIRLEASTLCQLACPSCPTTSGEIGAALGTGFLKFDAFRRLIDENPWIWRVELSNWGEIFLNPDIERIIAYAYDRSVALTAWNGANLNHVRGNVLEALARYRFRGMTCSIDGVSQETYVAYRQKGDLRRVLGNLEKLNAYKAKWKTEYPRLRWQMVAFAHNAHEVDAARAMAGRLGMEFVLKANWDPGYSPVTPPATTATADAPLEESEPAQGSDWSFQYCTQLWEEPQINFDGRLLGCCVNSSHVLGPNAFEVGLARALTAEKLTYAKGMLLGERPPRDDVPCTTCEIYVRRAAAGEWVRPPSPRGLAWFFRRRGLGRVVTWIDNRFRRRLLPVMRRLRLA
jgi:hypothetical protein